MHPRPLPSNLPPSGFSTAQAARAGVTRARTRAADLDTPYARTRVVRSAPFGIVERSALVLSLIRPGAFVCGPTAAALHGIPLPSVSRAAVERRLDVAVPPTCRAPRIRGVRGRALTVRFDEIDLRHGVPATTPERTWCDLASELGLAALVAAGDHLLYRRDPLTTVAVLAEHVERSAGRRGHRRLVAALPLLSDAAESPKESELRVLVVQAGLPAPEVNVDIFNERGRFVARVDLLLRDARIVLEYEGDHHRVDRAQWQRDLARVGDLESLGYAVIRVTAADLASPSSLIARIERHLRRNGASGHASRQ